MRVIAIILGIVLVVSAPAAGAAGQGPRRYKVDAVEASWAVPKQREGQYRMWSFEAARYEDLESGEVSVFATAKRSECVGDDDGLSCGSSQGPWKYESGAPEEFTFADDLSRASVRLGKNEVEWILEDPAQKPWELVPYGFHREEGCPEGSGSGDGVYRRMRARGSVFGRTIEYTDERSFVGVARYVLETECDPSGWWLRSGGAIAPR